MSLAGYNYSVAAVVAAFVCGALTVFVGRWLIVRFPSEPDAYFFKHLKVERVFWVETEGVFLKDRVVAIKERLLYKQFPLTSWSEERRRIDQTLDLDAIERFVRSVAPLLAAALSDPAQLIVRHLVGHAETVARRAKTKV